MMNGPKNSGYSAPKTVGIVCYTSHVPAKGSKNSSHFVSKTVATLGHASHVPAKGSKNSGHSVPKTVATVGHTSHVPARGSKNSGHSAPKPVATLIYHGARGGGGGEGSYETKSRISHGDNRTGCYRRTTTKEKVSVGEFHRKSGTTGMKCEHKKSSTVRIGDKGGYTEVYNEQRVRHVSYNKCGGSSSSSKRYLTY